MKNETRKKKKTTENVVKEAQDIDFQVRSGRREEIPSSDGEPNLELLSSLIMLCWKQIPNGRPTFHQIDQKLSPAVTL